MLQPITMATAEQYDEQNAQQTQLHVLQENGAEDQLQVQSVFPDQQTYQDHQILQGHQLLQGHQVQLHTTYYFLLCLKLPKTQSWLYM